MESFFQWMEVLLGFPTCQEVLQAEQEIKLATIFSVPKNHIFFGIGWKLIFLKIPLWQHGIRVDPTNSLQIFFSQLISFSTYRFIFLFLSLFPCFVVPNPLLYFFSPKSRQNLFPNRLIDPLDGETWDSTVFPISCFLDCVVLMGYRFSQADETQLTDQLESHFLTSLISWSLFVISLLDLAWKGHL